MKNRKKPTSVVELIVVIASITGTLFTLLWVLWFSQYGFDFTDESFYLIWISKPFDYSVSVTQFGFIYHPLYEFLNGNIASLRQANILITFCLAWLLSNVFLKTMFDVSVLPAGYRLIISASFATTSLIFLDVWLATPSYNGLVLQALMITATGWLLANNNQSSLNTCGGFLIGFGGWLAFMAKPTSAAALAVCTIFYWLMTRKLCMRVFLIVLATVISFLVVSAVLIDGSVSAFVDRLKDGVQASKMLGGGHTFLQIMRWDDFTLRENDKLILASYTGLFVFCAFLSQMNIKGLVNIGKLLSILLIVIGILIGLRYTTPINLSVYEGLLIWSVPFAAVLLGFIHYQFTGLRQIKFSQWVLICSFLLFPHIYAIGTTNNYWNHGIDAAIFWVLAGLVFLRPIASREKLVAILLTLGMGAMLITVEQIHRGIEVPYRQPQALYKNSDIFDVGRIGSTLILENGFSDYISGTINLVKQLGFKKGTPMIDLTGQSPGLLYALGAHSLGQAWMIGGYSGSKVLAQTMLEKVSCQKLSTAWILAEPDGPRKISPEVLLSFGADLTNDFEVVGSFKTASGVGGYKQPRLQQIIKPTRSVAEAISACDSIRKNK
jgi:hypothetical protein